MLKSLCWNGLTGLFCGLALMSGTAQFWLNCGTSLPAQTGFAVMFGSALALVTVLRMFGRIGPVAKAFGLFLLSASTLAIPRILNVVWSTIAAAGSDPFASTLAQIASFTVIASIALCVPTICTLMVLTYRSHIVMFAFGICLGTRNLSVAWTTDMRSCRICVGADFISAFDVLFNRHVNGVRVSGE